MHAVAVAAAVRSAHQASGHIPRAVIVAPGVGLEFVAADAAGADHGLASVPAVAGVVDAFCRLLDDRHLLDPAAQLGRGAVVADAGTGTYRYPAGAARLRPERLPAMKGRAMPVSRGIRVMVGGTVTIKRN